MRITKIGISKLLIAVFSFTMLFSSSFVQYTQAATSTYLDSTASVDDRVADLLSQMTLAEKAGQMVQGERASVATSDVSTYLLGSVLSGGGSAPPSGNSMQNWYDNVNNYQAVALTTRLRIPLIYGIDAVHGDNNVAGATVFPHNIGLGAIGEGDPEDAPALVQSIGSAVAQEVLDTGATWTFAPCLANPQDERWGRTYEGFGEELSLASLLGPAYVKGFQGDPNLLELKDPSKHKIAATIKHYLGEGYTANGTNQGNVTDYTKEQLDTMIMQPYIDAVNSGARTIMPSYNSIQGIKMSASKYFLTDVLKTRLGFTGFVISDYNAVDQINKDESGNSVSGFENQLKVSINAGMDMIMEAQNWKVTITDILDLVSKDIASPGTGIPMTRINDAVSRILRVKFQLGLFENPMPPNPASNPDIAANFGSAAHRAIARDAVSKSLVLLKNDNINIDGQLVPILSQLKNMKKIFVAGKSADNLGNQCGGWTISWQGGSGNNGIAGTTILQGIKNAVGSDTTVNYSSNGIGAVGNDVAIAVIGETPYAETNGDNLNNLTLDATDQTTLTNLKASGIPTIVVLVSGRPMVVTKWINDWAGLIEAWLPGSEGEGVADVLFGNKDFVGKLPLKWPFSSTWLPLNGPKAFSSDYILFNTGYGLTKGESTPQLPPTPAIPVGRKAWYQNFELGTGFTAGTNATVASDSSSESTLGTKSVKLTVSSSADPSTTLRCVNAAPQSGGTFDTTGYSYLDFFVKDTVKSNTIKVTLVDTNNNVSSLWTSTGSVLNVWTKISVPLGSFSGVNLSAIKEIRLGEWNKGTYYFDDIYMSQFDTDSIPDFNTTYAPTASPAAGSYKNAQTVTLSNVTTGAAIYYTLDGSTPTTASAIYYDPINIGEKTTVKAITVVNGNPSDVATFTYSIPYKNPPVGAEEVVLPAQIEAENYIYQNGWNDNGTNFLETTTDTGGGMDVGYTAAGNWLEYYVDVPRTGTYNVNFRVSNGNSSDSSNCFSLLDQDGNNLYTGTVPKTGGWQTWTTISTQVKLTSGPQMLVVYCNGGGFNLNWLNVSANFERIADVNITTSVGIPPQLPSVVQELYSDGSKTPAAVTWESINPLDYAQEGNFTVHGTIVGTSITAIANITVKEAEFSVVFKDKTGRILKSETVERNNSAIPPDHPTLSGYEFVNWDKDFSKVTSDMIINAIYQRTSDTYKVTVAGGKLSNGGLEGNFQFDMPVTVVANTAPSKQKFGYWELNGKKISTDSTFTFFVPMEATTLTAIFVDQTATLENKPFITLLDNVMEDTTNKTMGFTASRFVPSGYSLVESGVLLLKSDNLIGELKFDTPNVIRGTIDNSSSNQFYVRKLNISNGDTWYARAYLTYKDANGDSFTVYSGNTVSRTMSGGN